MSNVLFVEPPRNVIIGIDLGSFQFKGDQPFYGIKDIPHNSSESVHVIHFQSINGNGNGNNHNDNRGSDEDGDVGSARYGYWFTKGNFYITYDTDSELYIMHEELDNIKYEANLKTYAARNLLTEYPTIPEVSSSQQLLGHVSWSHVRNILSVEEDTTKEALQSFRYIDSSMTSKEENELLFRTIGDNRAETFAHNSRVEKTLKYTDIKFKSKAAIRDNYHMQDFLDKSYYFNEVILKQHFNMSISGLLGELQFAFLNAVLFANYGSSLQWHSIIELICKSSRVDPSYMKELDFLLSQDINVLPIEYVEFLLNMSLWGSILNDSFQKDNLVLTRKAISTKVPELIQDYPNEGYDDDDGDGDDDSGSVCYNGRAYLQLDCDSEDEYKPTVVGGVYYEPRPKF